MEGNSSSGLDSNLTCFSDFEATKYKVLLGLRVVLSLISASFLVCMLFIIIIFKKYVFFTQKLILLLATCSLAYDVVASMNVTALTAYRSKPDLYYCYVIGFFEQVATMAIIMAYFILALDIFLRAVLDKQTEKLKLLYLMLVLSPILYSWVPFIFLAYGPIGAVCWIRNKNLEDCSDFLIGDYIMIAIFSVPFMTLLVTIIVLMVISLSFVRWKKKKWGGRKEEKRMRSKMEEEIRSLIYYPFVLVFIHTFGLITSLYDSLGDKDTIYDVLIFVSTIIYRFQGILICCIFVLDPETRKKLNRKEIVAALKRMCMKDEEESIRDYRAEAGRSDSLPKNMFDSIIYTQKLEIQ
ncbi:PREDICTED: uncharacterized protein LOC109581188 [Amphimedon queenslandica]|nr:PREDICTED: uncharacterized protein LOC109581188 [Amphimedon queenslandica]|eukprot:XP_019850619.1 PREDICTED: uncharacterized protein LOC109581188 [Amphimedon queenslandica]